MSNVLASSGVSVRDEFVRAVRQLSVVAVALSDDELQGTFSELEALHALPGDAPLWERMTTQGQQGADKWREASGFFSDEVVLLSDADSHRFGFRLAADDVTRVLAECFGFVFYLTDPLCSTLVSFNDHDVLIISRIPERFPLNVWGTCSAESVERVQVVRAKGGFLLLTLERGQTFDVWLGSVEDVEAALAELQVRWR